MAKKSGAPEVARPTITVGSNNGLVFCSKCGVIRHDDGKLFDICHICEEGKWLHTNDIDTDHYGGDVKEHRKQILQKLMPWDLPMPDNVEITLHKADQATGIDRMALIMQAHVKAETFYYKSWAEGDIAAKKKKGPPMPDDVKELLRKRKHPEPIHPEYLIDMKITIPQVKKASPYELKKLFEAVYDASAGANLTTEGIRSSIIGALEEQQGIGRYAPGAIEAAAAAEDAAEASKAPSEPVKAPVVKEKAPKVPKKAKIPLFKDMEGMARRETSWPWVAAGSWREDPEHPGATLVTIKCTKCDGIREIHAADAFQVKLCRACKPSKGA